MTMTSTRGEMEKKTKGNTLSISRYGGPSRLKVLGRLSPLLK